MNTPSKRSAWKVGEIARMTGLSIRTLHHYDEIGLLHPSVRGENGHRIFIQEDLARLQQILSLRHLGLSLEEIKRTLDDPHFSFLEAITRLRNQLGQQRIHIEEVDTKLASLQRWLTTGKEISSEQMIQYLEVMAMFEKYLSAEQQDAVSANGQTLGAERVRQAKSTEWPQLIAEVQKELENGTDPKDPRVYPLATRWMGLVSEFTGGDPKIAQGIRKMYESEPNAASAAGYPGIDMPKLMNYISEILNAGKNNEALAKK
jgi:MerR family transcriptional regulator, thiopeptide resistance regulator